MSNGYRSRRIFASGNMLELRVPRTRRRGFMPLILGILKDQEREMGELAAYFYSCGNTMEEISEAFATFTANGTAQAKSTALRSLRARQLRRGIKDRFPAHTRRLLSLRPLSSFVGAPA